MPGRPHKYNLLFDENLESNNVFPRLKNFHKIKHLVKDFKKSGFKDSQVFELAKKEKMILVTYNYKDFNKSGLTKDIGIIGVSHSLSFPEIDKKLMSFLRKHTPAEVYGHRFLITGDTRED